MYGFAANQNLLQHYVEVFNGEIIAMLHPYNLLLMRRMRKELGRCMIMTGQMTKYKESLRHMPEPIMLSQIQKKVDLRGLMNYAKEKGIKVTQLTNEEKNRFLL